MHKDENVPFSATDARTSRILCCRVLYAQVVSATSTERFLVSSAATSVFFVNDDENENFR